MLVLHFIINRPSWKTSERKNLKTCRMQCIFYLLLIESPFKLLRSTWKPPFLFTHVIPFKIVIGWKSVYWHVVHLLNFNIKILQFCSTDGKVLQHLEKNSEVGVLQATYGSWFFVYTLRMILVGSYSLRQTCLFPVHRQFVDISKRQKINNEV